MATKKRAPRSGVAVAAQMRRASKMTNRNEKRQGEHNKLSDVEEYEMPDFDRAKARAELKLRCARLWALAKRGYVPTAAQREELTRAYWDGLLPDDPDTSPEQWVEDGFPEIYS